MDNHQKTYFCKRIDDHFACECETAYPLCFPHGLDSATNKGIMGRNRRKWYPWRSELLAEATSLKDQIVLGELSKPIVKLEAFCSKTFEAEELNLDV